MGGFCFFLTQCQAWSFSENAQERPKPGLDGSGSREVRRNQGRMSDDEHLGPKTSCFMLFWVVFWSVHLWLVFGGLFACKKTLVWGAREGPYYGMIPYPVPAFW